MDRLPTLITDRLILREIEEYDCYDMYEYACLPFVGPNAGWKPHVSVNETKEIIKLFRQKKKFGQLGVFAVVLKENNKMIGTIELHSYARDHKAELGYTINPNYWGNGYAVEASKEIIAWGFNYINLKRIECCAFVDNTQSIRVCEKLGFQFEGIKRKGYILYNGMAGDLTCFAMIDDDFYKLYHTDRW